MPSKIRLLHNNGNVDRATDRLARPYIASNPFRSPANNVVPAVVVFSILLGVAILGLPGKERILAPLSLLAAALGRAGSLLVRLTPYGLFAIAGHSAGTLRLEEFERLQAFLLVYVGLAVILTLWVLPGLVSVLTSLSYRRIVSLAQDPLLTAFVTANLLIVLPLLAERGKVLFAEEGPRWSIARDVLGWWKD